jgi:hypothetical protein
MFNLYYYIVPLCALAVPVAAVYARSERCCFYYCCLLLLTRH